MCGPNCIFKVLLAIGGLNWGLVGVQMLLDNGTNLNVVNLLLGNWPVVEAIVYLVVGVAALWMFWQLATGKCCRCECPPKK